VLLALQFYGELVLLALDFLLNNYYVRGVVSSFSPGFSPGTGETNCPAELKQVTSLLPSSLRRPELNTPADGTGGEGWT
jgi:hypothetical protein